MFTAAHREPNGGQDLCLRIAGRQTARRTAAAGMRSAAAAVREAPHPRLISAFLSLNAVDLVCAELSGGFWVSPGGVRPSTSPRRCSSSASSRPCFCLFVSTGVVALRLTRLPRLTLTHQTWRPVIFLPGFPEAPGNSLYLGGIHPAKGGARNFFL